jgi:uncharacterized membrane protein YdjX (TVP38/TMEM64 family)
VRKPSPLRIVTLLVLVALIAAAFWYASTHELGRRLLHDPHALGADFRAWVAAHPVIAPLAFIAVYVVLALLALPVWCWQILGGYGFGLVMGIVWCTVGATCGAVLTLSLSHWLTAEWLHRRAMQRLPKLRQLEEKLGHNGLLIVMATRLAHLVPFGISNYCFGLTPITRKEAALGTAWGGLPAIAVYVTIGSHPLLLKEWRYWVILVGANLVLLLPLALRYLRPHWFDQGGVA